MPKVMNLVTAGWTHTRAEKHQQMSQSPDQWRGEACRIQQRLLLP